MLKGSTVMEIGVIDRVKRIGLVTLADRDPGIAKTASPVGKGHFDHRLPTDHADILRNPDLRFPNVERAAEKPEPSAYHENNCEQPNVFDIAVKHGHLSLRVKNVRPIIVYSSHCKGKSLPETLTP
jgi:hypothetical protein